MSKKRKIVLLTSSIFLFLILTISLHNNTIFKEHKAQIDNLKKLCFLLENYTPEKFPEIKKIVEQRIPLNENCTKVVDGTRIAFSIPELASYTGDYQLISFLISKGFDFKYAIFNIYSEKVTPQQKLNILKKVVKDRNVYEIYDNELPYYLLIWAIDNGCKRCIDYLIQTGIDINKFSYKQICPPIFEAINNPEIFFYLIEKGADIHSRCISGNTLLHEIALTVSGKMALEEAKFLISKGLSVNAKNCLKQTPLHIAAELGKKELALLFIKAGADVNAQDKYGKTPLHYCVVNLTPENRKAKMEIAKYLLKHGANPNVKDFKGLTPLDIARKNRDKKLLSLFKD